MYLLVADECIQFRVIAGSGCTWNIFVGPICFSRHYENERSWHLLRVVLKKIHFVFALHCASILVTVILFWYLYVTSDILRAKVNRKRIRGMHVSPCVLDVAFSSSSPHL